jgi:hypothetical protein
VYRTAVAIKEAPEQYPTFALGKEVRQPVELLNHMSMLLSFVTRCYTGEERIAVEVGDWSTEVPRFYDVAEKLDRVLESGASPRDKTAEQLLQGPLADAMTHVGQLAMLRRMADSPVVYENYMKADIRAGQLRPL